MLPVECLFLAALAVGCLHRTAPLPVVWRHSGSLWAAAAAAAALLNALFAAISAALYPAAHGGGGGGGVAWEVWVVGCVWAVWLVALGELVRVHDRNKVRTRPAPRLGQRLCRPEAGGCDASMDLTLDRAAAVLVVLAAAGLAMLVS
jgi:hypothetical protein